MGNNESISSLFAFVLETLLETRRSRHNFVAVKIIPYFGDLVMGWRQSISWINW